MLWIIFWYDDAMRVIDIHTHGLGRYDTRTTSATDILKIAELQGAQGVTDIVPTIYSGPVKVMRKHMVAVKKAIEMQRTARDNSKFKIQNSSLARIAGIHLEGPFLNPTRAGALDPSSFQKPSEKKLRRLIEGFEEVVKIVTIAPEMDGAINLIRTMSDMGMVVSLGHSDATYTEAEEAFHAGAKGITHLFNAMRWMHHREPGLAGFGLMNTNIFVEVIADPFHLHKQTVELIFKMKNPGKIIIVSDSIKDTNAASAWYAEEDNNMIIQGGSMTIVEVVKRLAGLGFDEGMVVDCISSNPLSYLLPDQ
jgi:N-acetylglucosamine-6-phosphate deacetylase